MKAIIILLFSTYLFAHRGGTIKSGPLKGCHNNRKSGGFHCHSKSSLNGQSFASKEEALKSISNKNSLPSKKNTIPKYKRSLYGRWQDDDNNCLNTRHEILKARSLVPVVIKNCKVVTGKWADYYFNEFHTKSSEVEIDHLVPLKEAHISGAYKWSRDKKIKFSNDLENLVITSTKYNSQKGAQTPLTWSPIDKKYACRYITDWLKIKMKYHFPINKKLEKQFKEMKCKL